MGSCCGGGGTGGAAAAVTEGALVDPGDTRVYLVSYDNGVTEQVTGIDAVRQMAFTPSARTADAQEAGPSVTYTLLG